MPGLLAVLSLAVRYNRLFVHVDGRTEDAVVVVTDGKWLMINVTDRVQLRVQN